MSGRGRTPAAAVAGAAGILVRDYLAVRPGEVVVITADQSLWIDGEQIAEHGALVGPPRLATLAERPTSMA